MKKVLSILLVLVLILVPIAACDNGGGNGGNGGGGGGGGGQPAQKEDVTLTLWGGEEDQTMLRARADAFIALHADEVNLTINIGIESESTVRDTVLTDPQAAADVFAMADDQLISLFNAGALQEIVVGADAVRAANGASSVEIASIDGKLFAYPMTADNGYFMFYDKSFFTEDDVKSWDKMLEVAEAAGKQITMAMGNGWYSIGFMRGAGLDAWLEDDGSTGTTFGQGAAVLQGMLDIAKHPGFINLPDNQFITVITDGSVIAGINGPWNADAVAGIWGDNYAAAKLPTFNVGGAQTQMGGVLGFKLMGVNAFSANAGWAMKLADFLTNYESQVIRFELRGQAPTNTAAAASPEVQANPALAAIGAQAAYSGPMVVGDNYWGIAETLFSIIADGNPDGTPFQDLLDNAVAGMGS
ncbi:MAG: extracellular solute-binding protein [Oscillospiraceae bacterium]|nr:extracellular solute-binding protein [Oscillospiraceae bacterium]